MQTGRIATTDLQLPLDSVLSWAWMMENHPELMVASQSGMIEDDMIIADLPLERRDVNGEWYWACSFAFGEPEHETRSHWHKRLSTQDVEKYVDFGDRRGTVNTKSGFYKGYRMPLTEFLVPQLEWWLVGDERQVGRLLSRVTHLGKKRSQGKGRVAKWVVECANEDRADARPIPDPNGETMVAIRPPYWWHKNEVLCRWPDEPRLACNWIRSGHLVS